MNVTSKINDCIRQHNGSERDALNVTLAKVEAAESRVNSLLALVDELESRFGWVLVSNNPFPDRNGILVCWDGCMKYCAFYFNEFTVELPIGTTHYFLLPEPPEEQPGLKGIL